MENLGPSLDLNTVNLLCTVVTKASANMPSTAQPNVMQPAQTYTAMQETTIPAEQVFNAQGQVTATRTVSQASNGFELTRLPSPYANGINVGSITNFSTSEVNQMIARGKQSFITTGLPNINSFSDPIHFIPQASLNTCGPSSFIEKNERLPSFSTIVASAASSSPVIGLQRQFPNNVTSTVEHPLTLPSPVSSSSPIQSNASTNIVATTNIPLSTITTNADGFQTIPTSFTNYYAGQSTQQLVQQQTQPQHHPQQQQHQSVIQHLPTGTTKAVSSSLPAACTSQVMAGATTLVLSSSLHHSHPKARLSLSLPLSSSSPSPYSEENGNNNAKNKPLLKTDKAGDMCEQNLSKHKSKLSPEHQEQFVNAVHLSPQIPLGSFHQIIDKTGKQSQILISDQVTSLKTAKKNKDFVIIAPTQVNPAIAKQDMVPIYFSPVQNSVQTPGVAPVVPTVRPPPQMMSMTNKSKGVQFFVMGKLEGKSTSEGFSYHDQPSEMESADLPISFEKHPVDGIVVKRMAPVTLQFDFLGKDSLDFVPQDSDMVKQEPPEKRLESTETQQVDLQLLLQQQQQQQQQQQLHVQTTIQQAEVPHQMLSTSPEQVQAVSVQQFQTFSPEQLQMPHFRQIQSQHLLQHLQTTQIQPQTQYQTVITADGQAQIAENVGQFTAQQLQQVAQQQELQLQQPEPQQLTLEQQQQQQQQQQQVVGTQLTIQPPLLSPLLSPGLPCDALANNAHKSPRQKQSGMVYMDSAAKAVVTTTVGDNATFVTVSIMNNRKTAGSGQQAKTDTTDSDLALGSLTSVTLSSPGIMEAGSSAVKRKLSDCSDSDGSECSDSESVGDKCDLSQDENQDDNLYTLKPPFVLPPLSSLGSPSAEDGVETKNIKEEFDRTEVEIRIDDSQCIVYGEQKRWQCCLCPKSYTTKHNLVTHILDHQGIKPHLCMICHKYFKQLSHLNTHMLTHENIKPHICQICNKGFTQISHLKRHKAVHLDSKPFLCDICNRGFAYPSELRVHKEKHIPGRDKCHDCGEDFTSQRLLRQHQATHEHREDLTCKMCTKIFRYPSQLKDHMITHSGTRPHICPECGMDFMKEHHLKAHQFTHTGLQPFTCPICRRAFNQKANMQRHLLIHNAERAFRCETCSKTFTQPQTLKAHMVVHAESKPYRCNLCSKEFGRLHNLQGHMHMHNNSKPFVCFCGSSFTLKGNLNRHKKVKHGLNETTESMEEDAVNFLTERCRDSEGDKDSSVDKFGEKDDVQGNKKHRKSGPRRVTSKRGSVTGKSGGKGRNGKGGRGGGGVKTNVTVGIIMGNIGDSNDDGIVKEMVEGEVGDEQEEEEEEEEGEEEEEEEEEDIGVPEVEEDEEDEEEMVDEAEQIVNEGEPIEEEKREVDEGEEEEEITEEVGRRREEPEQIEQEEEDGEGEEDDEEEEEEAKDPKDANVVTKYFKNHCESKKTETIVPNNDLKFKDVSHQDAYSFTSTDSDSDDDDNNNNNSSAFSESEKDDGAKEDHTDADWLPPSRKRRRRQRGAGGKVTNAYQKFKEG